MKYLGKNEKVAPRVILCVNLNKYECMYVCMFLYAFTGTNAIIASTSADER